MRHRGSVPQDQSYFMHNNVIWRRNATLFTSRMGMCYDLDCVKSNNLQVADGLKLNATPRGEDSDTVSKVS